MKQIKRIALFASCMLTMIVFAQNNETNSKPEKTEDGWYIYTETKHNNKENYRYHSDIWRTCNVFFDITHNDWTGDLKAFKMQGPSIGINIGFLKSYPILANRKLAIAWGLSYGVHRMKHDLNVTYDSEKKMTTIGPQGDFVVGSRKMISKQWSIPIELHFQTDSKHGLYCHVGGKIGYQSRLYEKGRADGIKYKHKNKFISDKEPWIYSIHARVGFKYGASLYASYNFNSLFRSSESTKLNLFELGISFVW